MSLHGYNQPVVWSDRPILGTRYGIGWAHAAPGGGPALRTETSRKTISGIWINTPRGAVWLYFRRWGS